MTSTFWNGDTDGPLMRTSAKTEVLRGVETAWEVAKSGGRTLFDIAKRQPTDVSVARELRVAFTNLGPTYVKLGQIIASSPGVFPEVMSEEFLHLLDAVEPADPRLIRQILIEDLGMAPEQAFAKFNPIPIASASIAQVHEATLKNGREVVVKVQRPKIRERLAADVRILYRLSTVFEMTTIGKMSSAKAIIEDFTRNLEEELDFLGEAAAMEEWQNSIRSSKYFSGVRVPEVEWELTTSRVLTMERVHGMRIDDTRALKAAGLDGSQIVKNLMFPLFESGLRGGLFHADLHAGNLMIEEDGTVIFLDFGIVGRMDENTTSALRDAAAAMLLRADFKAVNRAVMQLGALGKPGDPETANKNIQKLVKPLFKADLQSISYMDFVRDLVKLGKTYDAHLPRELVLAAKQLLYVERYIKDLAPDWQIIQDPEVHAYMAGVMAELAEEEAAEKAAAEPEAVAGSSTANDSSK